MSIIYEALKKLEDDRNTRIKNKRWKSMMVVSIILLFTGVSAYVISKKLFYFDVHPSIVKGFSQIYSSKDKSKNLVLSLGKTGINNDKDKKEVSFSNEQDKDRAGKVKYTLQGIIYDQSSPMALINGKSVKEGDEIDGGTVMKITNKMVEVKRGGKIFKLELD